MERSPISPGGEQELSNQSEQQLPFHLPDAHRTSPGDRGGRPSDVEPLAPDALESVVSGLAAAVPAESAKRLAPEAATAERPRSNKAILAVAKAGIEAVADQVRRNESL